MTGRYNHRSVLMRIYSFNCSKMSKLILAFVRPQEHTTCINKTVFDSLLT